MNVSTAAPRRVLVPAAWVMCVWLAAAPAFAAGSADTSASAGKAIFVVKCVTCHKPDGTGGVVLTGNPTPNWKSPKTWADPKRRAGDAYLRDCITNGKLKSGMPAWGRMALVKPAEIEQLIAYIHVLAGRPH